MKFIIKDNLIPLNNISYHHKGNQILSDLYRLIVPLSEIQTIEIIEKFAGESIQSKFFIDKLLFNNEQKGSLGLIWTLLINNLDINDEDSNAPYYMLNSVDKVSFCDGNLIVEGKYE